MIFFHAVPPLSLVGLSSLLLLRRPSFMNIVRRAKGMVTMAVIITKILTEVGSKGKPINGRKGIGNMNTSQTPARIASTFHLCLSLALIVVMYAQNWALHVNLAFGTIS